MSIQIPTHHVEQYRSAVTMLSQQKGSRYRMTCRRDGEVVGKSVYYDRIGPTAAVQVTQRHADTPLNQTPHSRRKTFLLDYAWADLIDRSDKYKTIYDPTNFYVRMAVWAMGRTMDDTIITAYSAAALEGESGATSTAFPAANQIGTAIGGANSGLNITKLLNAKELLDEGEVDPDLQRYCALSADQVTDLLNTTQIQSADYNTVKALVEGKIDTFIGFKFVRSERLATTSSLRRCMAYTEAAMGFETGQDVMVDIGPRRDKLNATQVLVIMGIAAVRIEDAQIMEMQCTE